MQLYVYRWRLHNPHLGGRVCRVMARGTMNSALVRFEDNGECHVVSTYQRSGDYMTGPPAASI